MLKHTNITLRRIGQFVEYELKEKLLGERVPLKIEFCGEAFATENEAAKKGVWQDVDKGFEYGPAYRTVWFRLTGKVPQELAGKQVGLVADIGSERTLWRDNSPWMGLDEPHNVAPVFESASGGAKVKYYIQAYTRNPQCEVHRFERPREQLVEKVNGAWLVVEDQELKDLYFDCAFSLNLLEAMDETDPAYQTILRTLNEVCNVFAARRDVGRCRKLIRNTMGALNGEYKHVMTAVGHAHLDTAWLWPIEITKKKMAHTTATQLYLMEKYPEYVFVHSQASQYEWLEKEYPELFKRVKAAIARGQWEPVGSMWVEADCNLTGSESMVRQFLYGRQYFREKLGFETDDMWLPDVFGYSAALPQILDKFNIKYFLTQKISWNQTNKFPHNTFLWQGIDGTKVWSHFPPADTYCSDCTPKEIIRTVKSHRDHGRSDQSLYVFGYGDGGGGPTEQHIEFLRRSREAPSMPEIPSKRRAIDFFREAKGKSQDLMTWAGELYLEAHRGTYTSQAANKKGNRFSEFLLRDAEILACFRDDFPNDYPADILEEAWKLVLLNQFHDIIPGSSVREVYVDSDRDYALIQQMGESVIAESLAKIGSKFDTTTMSRPVALFQNATTAGLGSITWTEGAEPASLELEDEVLPVQLVEEFGERKLIFPSPQSALGAVTVGDLTSNPTSGKYRLKASNRKIENHELSVRFDNNGNIVSVESMEDGSEFIAPGKAANVFQLFEDKPLFWSAWDIDPFSLETARDLVRCESFEVVEKGPVRAAVEVTRRFSNSLIRQRISVGPFPGIRFDTEIDWHEEDRMLKVAFPVNVNAAKATYEIQFGSVERPTHYNTSWDAARFEVCAQKWVDLSEGDQGVALLNDCKYGHDIIGNVMRITLLRAPKAPDPLCDMGRHRFSYVMLPHFGPHNYAGVVQAAYSLNAPLRHAFLQPSSGMQGALPPFVSCEDRNIVVEAVKKAERGSDLIIRAYECHNARGRAELSCVRTPRRAWLCDLEENKLEELDIHEGMINFAYRPFEILTIRIEV